MSSSDPVNHHRMQSWIIIDVHMRDSAIRDIVIGDLAVKASAARDSGAFVFIEVKDAGDVCARRMSRSPVERNDQGDWDAHLAKIVSHGHHGVGTEGMANQYNRSATASSAAISSAICRHSV
jgi:hypothetical protein